MDRLLQALLTYHFTNPKLHAFLQARAQGIDSEAAFTPN